MANTYSATFFHLVFSTKHRARLIDRQTEIALFPYLGGIARRFGCEAVEIGGVEDHIHSLVRIPPKFAPSLIVQKLKSNSSRYLNESRTGERFGWQDGYGLFSVSRSAVDDVARYIRNQRAHHAKMSFEDEYRELLRLHDVDIGNEKYWID